MGRLVNCRANGAIVCELELTRGSHRRPDAILCTSTPADHVERRVYCCPPFTPTQPAVGSAMRRVRAGGEVSVVDLRSFG
jgi:hypothetical protein